MSRNKRPYRGKKAPWDRGNGWKETKAEWQDFDKAVQKTVTMAELADLWCPASGSIITVTCDVPGLTFDLEVGPKEYHAESGRKRKPTAFGISYRTDKGKTLYYPFIPKADAKATQLHAGAWHKKFTWSSAVRELLNTIIPSYVEEGETMCLRSMALKQGQQMPTVQKSGEDEASTSQDVDGSLQGAVA